MTFTRALATNNYGPAKFIVDGTSTANGTHSTIATALTSASSGDTIFVRPGVYTENLTLKAGVNLTAYTSDAFTPNVTIVGKLSCSYSGTATISGIRLQTNSDNLIALTGANVTVLNINNCYLNCTNATGISSSGSNASAFISVMNSNGDVGTTGISLFSQSNGGIDFRNCSFTNSGATTTASTTSSAGVVSIRDTVCNFPITTSNTATIGLFYVVLNTQAQNVASLTLNGTGGGSIYFTRLSSGTATPLSIGAGVTLVANGLQLAHGNSVAVTGAGAITYSAILQDNTVGTISAGTNTGKTLATGGVTFDGGTNNLTNYTVGDWTPTFTGSSANPTSVTYTTQVGKYIRIGALVFVHATLTVNAVTLGAAAGNLQVSGLPFTAKNVANYSPMLATEVSSFDLGASTKFITAQVQNNSTNIAFIESLDNAGATVTAVTILAANTQVRISGCYET